jgi:hypothetical protein
MNFLSCDREQAFLMPPGPAGLAAGGSSGVVRVGVGEGDGSGRDARDDCFRGKAVVPTDTLSAIALDGGCCTKPSAKTWAALAVTVAGGAGSAEAGQGVPRPSDDFRLFRPHP